MIFEISREVLLRPLSQVANIVERKQTLPILSNVHMKLEDGTLQLTSTDLEIEIIASASVQNGTSGEVTVGARKLLDISKALPEGSILSFTLDGGKVVVKSGSSKFVLHTLPADEFPKIQEQSWDEELAIDGASLKGLMDRTAFAMANQDVRYYLNGLFLSMTNGKLTTVATDGHRLAKSDVADGSFTGSFDIIIPRKAVQEISRLLGDSSEEISLSINSNHIRFKFGELVFTSKLIEGRFPDYKNVIPIGQNVHIQLDRKIFRTALQRAAILTNDKFKGIRIEIKPDTLTIVANNPEQEEAYETMDIDYQGDAMDIGFNVTYMLDALNALHSETVQIGLTDNTSSSLIQEPDNDSTVYVVMPMRI